MSFLSRNHQDARNTKDTKAFSLGSLCSLCLCGLLLSAGCARVAHLKPLPAAKGGRVTVRVELTYNRNDKITIDMQAPPPDTYGPNFTRYVAWVATPDRKDVINIGQIRVEGGKGNLITLTPLRKFWLLVTVEERGDVLKPGPLMVFESYRELEW